jgi:hypothetical protein
MVLQRRRWFTEDIRSNLQLSAPYACDFEGIVQGGSAQLADRDCSAEARLGMLLALFKRDTPPLRHSATISPARHTFDLTRHREAAYTCATNDIMLSQLRSLRECSPVGNDSLLPRSDLDSGRDAYVGCCATLQEAELTHIVRKLYISHFALLQHLSSIISNVQEFITLRSYPSARYRFDRVMNWGFFSLPPSMGTARETTP